MAERGECFPEILAPIGIVPSRRNDRKRWSEPHKQNKPNVRNLWPNRSCRNVRVGMKNFFILVTRSL